MSPLLKILLVEDDHGIAMALAHALRATYYVEAVSTGKAAIYKTDFDDFDLIILDLNLPDISGLAVCQQLRERGITAQILVLSGESRVLTKIHLLDAGANDYLTKPFSLGELKARLRNLSRHTAQPIKPLTPLIVGDLSLDRYSYQARRAGVLIPLRPKEFALLECLMERAGTVVSRHTLMRSVWQGADELWTNTVEVHIKHLRDKIDRPFNEPLIKTVHGIGYKLEIPSPLAIRK